MFDRLKKAFSSAAKGIGQKEITEKLLDDTLLELQIALLESDVAQEVVDALSDNLKKELLGVKLDKNQDVGQIIQSKLQNAVAEIFARIGKFDLIEKINAKKVAKAGPYVIVFLGINGTGKTTTVAKVANILRKNGFSLVVAAGDTHRAGAIEQLTQHANRLSLKVIAQRYGADPSAVGRDAVEHAKKNYLDVVLIDTAGRMQTSKNLMDEMGKIVRVVKPDCKLFIGDALAGNDTINQAREFFQYTNFDGAILTKIDADAKGGSAMSIAHITSKPIAYIGIGQGYDDLIPFDPDKFIESLFGRPGEVSVQDLMSVPRPSSQQPAIEEQTEEEQRIAIPEKKEEERLLVPPPKPQTVQPTVANPMGIFAKTAQKEEEKEPAKIISSATPLSQPVIKSISDRTETIPQQKKVVLPPTKSKNDISASALPSPPSFSTPLEPEQPKEKKSRFGFFKKKSDDDRRKAEEEKRRQEKERIRKVEEEEEQARAIAEEEEQQRLQKENEKEKKTEYTEDKGTEHEEDKVIYLTDEDIEDLLK